MRLHAQRSPAPVEPSSRRSRRVRMRALAGANAPRARATTSERSGARHDPGKGPKRAARR
eukprot:CAMPEP_0204572914 /NCGR_PEP_ID=MMETSP0661-20131031/39725_1 /ASSEMBLY_ACC=CAM_ASM_000606 /TAXON_ID=109239 /ORGANISM="Alexandrium margalefi, Strain AMGDE01CS-322" /LENGTH=59 /DNA_ID=CAMNT_0051581293 /DNA_START=102 /DNA_END=281 /DNA_ORIENTATION=-